jgi:hypothetical protein
MKQTRLESFIEAGTNTIIGFGINYLANLVIIPFVFGVPLNLKQNLIAGTFFTIVSVIRSYTIRRYFNQHLESLNKRLHDALIKYFNINY